MAINTATTTTALAALGNLAVMWMMPEMLPKPKYDIFSPRDLASGFGRSARANPRRR
jgi:hypothetical protein